MEGNLKPYGLKAFEDYLVQRKYSKTVIPIYLRKVKYFLAICDINTEGATDCFELKNVMNHYVKQLGITLLTRDTQAAVHTYYSFCSGQRFYRRLSVRDFDVNPTIEHEIERFRKYLYQVAGWRVNTINSCCNTVTIFLCYCFEHRDFSPEKISADQVQAYLVKGLSHLLPSSRKTMVTRIRAYLKFLEFEDDFHSDEILKLPMTAPVWEQASLPKYLCEEDLVQLFSTYDLTKPNGIRNYAIARCMKDLGLRCSEVARLSLDDFDWNGGTLTIRNTKNHLERTLPLKEITGNSIVEYLLHARPVTSERRLFVRSGNQQGSPMETSQIRNTVRYAARKANLEKFTGTHMLRYTTAKEMLDNGTNFKVIADVLGHECLETTQIYAKLDFSHLREVAGIWPEVEK